MSTKFASAKVISRIATLTAISLATVSYADMIVDNNLGTLAPGSHAISGTTVGQANHADTYSPPGNPAAIWDQEYVYQFTTTQSVVAGVTTNDPNGAVDNDFFLLKSLST